MIELLVDLHSFDGILFQLLALVGYFWLAIIFHELGHLWYLRSAGFKQAVITFDAKNFRVGEQWMYDQLGSKAKNVYLIGILAGIPAILFYSVIAVLPFTMLLTLLYIAGCWSDFREMVSSGGA